MKMPQIFLSYSWEKSEIAEKIYQDLTLVGFDVIKDSHSLKYTDRIPDFMKKIRKADFALLLICDSYLKSINCMSEVMQLEKGDDVWKKILPVICKDAKFYEVMDRINYVNYWQMKSNAIESELKNIDPINSINLNQDLKNYKAITQNLDSFLNNLKEQLNVSPEDLFKKFYRPLTDKIGVNPDFSKMFQLIPISFIKDPKKRLLAIINFIQKYKTDNTYCYSIIASCYKDLRHSNKAIQFYKKAIQLDSFNYTAWNNLGQVYENSMHNYSEAKNAYEKAIAIKPNFDIPRLNLGVLLFRHFNDLAGAKAQYEEILKFDENNPKAHHNLSNIYNTTEYLDLVKLEYHLTIAVNQNNLEATISYANFLKVYKKNIELGNKFYQKAKLLDTQSLYREIIDTMLKSTKG